MGAATIATNGSPDDTRFELSTFSSWFYLSCATPAADSFQGYYLSATLTSQPVLSSQPKTAFALTSILTKSPFNDAGNFALIL